MANYVVSNLSTSSTESSLAGYGGLCCHRCACGHHGKPGGLQRAHGIPYEHDVLFGCRAVHDTQHVVGGRALASIIASVSFVNTRQMLYAAAFSPYFTSVRKRLTFLFSATVTDESFGVNLAKFQEGSWSAGRATLVNLFCMTTWALANVAGVFVGDALSIPTAIAAFAMTSIFICLLVSQKITPVNCIVVAVAAAGVCLLKTVGLSGPAILLGACLGVCAGMIARKAGVR